MFNPYYGYQPQMQMPSNQIQQITKVTGENGARTYAIGPNSSALLLDETAPLVWLVQTDGAGYKTITPFTITKYEPEPAPDYGSIMDRLTRLEEKVNEKSDIAVIDWPQTEQPDGPVKNGKR